MTNRDPSRILIERHSNADELQCAGIIEGAGNDGTRWIIFLDERGMPSVYWPQRDRETGAVIGRSISLTRRVRKPGRGRAATP